MNGAFQIQAWTVEPDLNTVTDGKRQTRVEPKAMKVLVHLADHAGHVVTKERLLQAVWPDTFVTDDVLTRAIADLRRALGDDARSPRFIQTIPKGGYRLIPPVESRTPPGQPTPRRPPLRRRLVAAALAAIILVAGLALVLLTRRQPREPTAVVRNLTRITFEPGLQSDPSFSPDGRFLAYTSDQAGNFDIWVRPVAGGDAVRVTRHPDDEWQPDWSPDGRRIAFRSERDGGGLFVVAPFGGPEQKVAGFGHRPSWSPDSSRILFVSTLLRASFNNVYLVGLDGQSPQRVRLGAERLLAWNARPAWHPDGHRLSILRPRRGPGIDPVLVDIETAQIVHAQVGSDTARAFQELELTPEMMEPHAWSPDGKAVYFVGSSNMLSNIWKLPVDTQGFRIVGAPQRLTTGPEAVNRDLVLSRDGRRIAYAARTDHARIWAWPLDAAKGTISGEPVPLTPPDIDSFSGELSRDGARLVFQAERAGSVHRHEYLVTSLRDGVSRTLRVSDLANDEHRAGTRLSPDGRRAVYWYQPRLPHPRLRSLRIMDVETGEESELTTPAAGRVEAWGWSPDGRQVLSTGNGYQPGRSAIALLPVAGAPHAESRAQIVTSSGDHRLKEAFLSTDGRWICFSAIPPDGVGSTVHVVRADGGPWTQITDGTTWDDKPQWSHDGKRIYFLSWQGGSVNVWSADFDPVSGQPRGRPRLVTRFGGPSGLSHRLSSVADMGISVSRDRLALMMAGPGAGHVWMLDGVDR